MSETLDVKLSTIIWREMRANRRAVSLWIVLVGICLVGMVLTEQALVSFTAFIAGSLALVGLIIPDAIRTIRLYFALAAIATSMVLVAFLQSTDLPGVLLNLATELFGAIIIFIVIERRFGSREIAQFIEQEITSKLHSLKHKILGAVNSTIIKQLERQLGDLDIKPNLYLRPDAIRNRFNDDTSEDETSAFDEISNALVPGTPLIEVYDQFGGSLLLLGLAGMGKTTSLLRLTRELVLRAQDNIDQAIPVFLRFRRWDWKNTSLQKWVVEEIAVTYQISPGESSALIQRKSIILILDGLDELPQVSVDTIAAVNEFIRLGIVQGIVLSCRNHSYEPLDLKLEVNMAVELMPLDEEQIHAAFRGFGPQYMSALEQIKQDNRLYPVLTNPLAMKIILQQLERGSFPQPIDNAGILISEMIKRAVRDVADSTKRQEIEIMDFLKRFCQLDSMTIPQLPQSAIDESEQSIVDGLKRSNLIVQTDDGFMFAHRLIADFVCENQR
ncbi:MAG TPA: NACHT domain-containing protein [Bellilinea sp.]|nr:NACHT domain-containing protein [Bellilinea sp.]